MSSEREQQMEKLRTGGYGLNLGEETVQTAEILYRKVTDESDLVGLGIDSVLATTLLIASKQNRLPVTVSDIYKGWHDVFEENEIQDSFSKKKIGRIERKFTEEFGLEIPPNQPDVLINRYAEELDMPKAMSTTAQDILSDVLDAAPSVVTGGRAPSAIAATSLSRSHRV
jgi:transcription initiation factor TFIIIB Brf1 subunit/transcription initiation factor TFIIB